MNHSSRHKYYVNRTIDWLKAGGYEAECVEQNNSHAQAGCYIYSKKDLWGSDVIFRRGTPSLVAGTGKACSEGCNGVSNEAIGFVQVKTSQAQTYKGTKQLTADENWPACVWRLVIFWPERTRLTDGPLVKCIGAMQCLEGLLPLPFSGQL